MAKTASPASSANSSGNLHHKKPGPKPKYHLQSSSSTPTSSTSSDSKLPLPQCKVKRNYACAKCPYYTQNPRSFLHHQKNVHAERLKVYECSHCLYASKHSQKLQRHVQMVHVTNKRGKSNREVDENGKQLLVPPVRIRVQRFEKFTDQHLAKLVIVEDVDVDEETEVVTSIDDESSTEEHTVSIKEVVEEDGEQEIEAEAENDEDEPDEEDADGEEEEQEDEEEDDEQEDEADFSNDGSADADDIMPEVSLLQTVPSTQQSPAPPPPSQQQKKSHKQDKHPVTLIQCSVCPFGSHSRTLVNRHEKSAHLKKKFFRCMKCNYVTHMRARYTKHVKYHTMPMIKCEDCDFRTPYKWNLDRHNRNHSSIAPGTYKCSHCSFSADIKQSLTVHETNHHVPPVGGVFPSNGTHRRRYRVGASDAPGSAVDGTEIVTYETTKEGGIVEIMTETKSTSPTVTASSGGGSMSKVAVTKAGGTSSTCTVVKKTTTTTTTTTTSLPPAPIKVISVTSPPEGGSLKAAEQKPRRRPMPKLIPIVDQQLHLLQQRRVPPIIRLRPSQDNTAVSAAAEDYYNLTPGQSALSDFASIIDDADCASGPFNSTATGLANVSFAGGIATASGTAADRRPSSGSTSSSSTTSSPKSKTASFFDKLKAKVDETADLTCQVCRYESKCLSEFMRHQRTHGGDPAVNAAITATMDGLKTEDHTAAAARELTPTPLPPPPVTAAELKSTRCQRCRKRCKTSTELLVHLATCRGTTAVSAAVAAIDSPPDQSAAVAKETVNDEDSETQQHPMENKIFVWNTAPVTATPQGNDDNNDEDEDDERDERDSVTVTKVAMSPNIEPPSADREPDDESENDTNHTPDNNNPSDPDVLQHKEQLKHAIRKEGKMYKTVFKCPHCTFWAATASRFHVHIVGHLNRKPFECSCCAYRSNWRWDITKHIRLKSARKGGAEESVQAVANSHQGAKVLMTDETGRRNYSKYNRYLTVMEMDIADGADKAAGGECEDGKGVRKSVGGGIARKRRAPSFVHGNKSPNKQYPSQTSKAAAIAGQLKRFKAAAIRNQQLNQHMTHNNGAVSTPSPPSATGGDNRSKTVWKCKKCFFRDCDRLTVLNHVKAHYRRGEFSGNSSATGINSSQHDDTATTATDTVTTATNNELYVQTKKMANIKETTEQNSPTTDRRKTKTPTTGTTSDTLLLLSTNPKSLMLYDDENFLSCPLCDMTAPSPGQLKEHMQSTHIPEETKYRCEYCPFWSEEKKAMLDHMMFAHEMDDGSVNTDINATDANYGTEQRDESASNSINYDDEEEMQAADENGSDDAIANIIFDNGSDDATTNMEVLFDTNDENIVVVETVECKPDFVDNGRGSTIETSSTPNKSSEKSNYSSTAADEKINDNIISSEYDGVEERDEDEQVEDEEIIVGAEEVTEPTSVKIIKATLTPITSAASKGDTKTISRKEIEVFECNECWYYSTNKRDLLAHKQLHVDRGALFHCTECVFNVTKSAILYHHYRHGHVIEEPELQFPEDSIVGAGQRDMNAKNSKNKLDNKTANPTDVDETTGPSMVWHYSKENIPPFTKVFKCRYCPHTNRRRHNTIDHERMHSDHPEHQHHRQMQQRLSGCSVPSSPLHPCKRCTYVCNNAGVLASHVKVHSTSYRCTTVGFYDTNSVDASQMRALEYVMELERSLMLDKNTAINSGLSLSGNEVLSDSSSDNESPEDITKYTEIDEPELKFCPYCPARYFFRVDLQFHIRFHRFRGWKNSCDCCSFVARARSHVEAHEAVHCDEYEQRTNELLASGYPVNPKYPRPSEYPVSVNDDLPQLQKLPGSPPQSLNYKHSKTHSTEPNSQRQRRIKRVRNSEPNVATIEQPPSTEYDDDNGKRRRRSTTVGVAMKSANAKPPPPALLPVSKTTNSKSPPPPFLPVPKTTVATVSTEIKSTSSVDIKPDDHESTDDPTVKSVKPTKGSYIRQFMCTMCPGKFFKSAALQYHKTLHGGPGHYRCRCCDYAVSTYGNLVRHESVHRDLPAREKVKTKTSKKLKALKKLKAKGKKIPLPVNLSTSILDSQVQPSDATDDEDFQIDPEFGSIMLGNPSFFYPTTVKNGVVRSKRYKCPKCPSAFDKRDQYAVHLTLHGAQDKYQCDKCDYAVRYTANYVQHQRKHARDAEIRKNHEQAAEKAKMIKQQEEAANVQRIRKRSTVEDRKPQFETKPVLPLVVKLQPQDTTFTNEISDQQTAYELNAAYGATGNLVGETITSLFRCAHCPFECDIRSQLDRHTTHHFAAMNSSGAASKRSWKRSCRFCTYRTHGEIDLAEHTRVHFLRSTGEPASNNEEYSTDDTATISTDIDDHVEFHGKRVVYSQRKRNNNDQIVVAENLDEKDIKPFFVFKDYGDVRYRTDELMNGKTAAAIVRTRKRFSPDCPPPQMAIDYNDNRTGDAPKTPSAAFVRFLDNGSRLEFLDDDPVEPAGKRRRSKK